MSFVSLCSLQPSVTVYIVVHLFLVLCKVVKRTPFKGNFYIGSPVSLVKSSTSHSLYLFCEPFQSAGSVVITSLRQNVYRLM